MNTHVKILSCALLLIFIPKALLAQPDERDILKYRQDKLQAFLKSLESPTPSTKAERAPESFQVSEKAKTGFSLPEYGDWYNTKFPPTLKDQYDTPSMVVIFDLMDLRSEAFINDVVKQLGGFKKLKIRGVVKKPKGGMNDMMARKLQKMKPEFPFVMVDDFKTLNGTDTLAIPSAVLVQSGLQATIQIKTTAEIADMASICEKLEPTFKSADSRSKGTSFTPDARLERVPQSVLFYPTDVIKSGGSYYISDSGNNRILELNKDGDVIQVIGSRKPGLKDGKGDRAFFSFPTGLAMDENAGFLYISDTHNHCIRRLDTNSGAVTTVLGTGKEATGNPQSAKGSNDPISFPSEIELYDDKLFIAMAGLNQIWVMDLKSFEAKPQIGAAPKKKKKRAVDQSFSQPTGLDVSGSKTIRISSAFHGQVTETGGKKSLSLIDAKKGIKSIYDPIEVNGKIYFTDPMGSALWVMEEGNLRKLVGSEGPGLANGSAGLAKLFFPCGISQSGGELLIADALNDAIRVYDINKNELNIFALGDYEKAISDIRNPVGNEGVVYAEPLEIGEKSSVTVKIKLPEGMVINAYKNNRVELMEEEGIEFMGADFEENFLEFAITKTESTRQLYFELELNLSDTKNPGQVYYRSCRVLIPLIFSPSGSNKGSREINVLSLLND